MDSFPSFPLTHTIAVTLSAINNGKIVCLVDNDPSLVNRFFDMRGQKFTTNGIVDELLAFTSLTALPDAAFPQIDIEDSVTEQTIKTLEVQWNQPRRDLKLWLSKYGLPWISIGVVPAQNPGGYENVHYRLLDRITDALAGKIGAFSRIGISVEEAGHGLLQSGESISIYGSFTQEVIYQNLIMPVYDPPQSSSVPKATASTETTTAVTATSGVALAANNNRLGYAIKNEGANTVFLNFDAAATTTSIITVRSGSIYYNEPYMQTRQVTAICATGQTSSLKAIEWT